MKPLLARLGAGLVGMLVAFSAVARDDSSRPAGVPRPGDREALSAETVGAGPRPGAVPAPASYDLWIENDVRLGGAVFRGGHAFLHDDGTGTALGSRALDSLTSGKYNTAVGIYVLTNNTSGNSNTAVGDSAMVSNQTGHWNTAVGQYALRDNQHSIRNTAVGFKALAANVGFMYYPDAYLSSNTAVGAYAMAGTSQGYQNAALGAYALELNQIGKGNTAVGFKALYSSVGTVGVDPVLSVASNTAVGILALSNVTTGYRNLALGSLAGSNLTTSDSENVLLNSLGVAGDNNTLRIGQCTGACDRGLDAAYIHGIHGQTSTGGVAVLVNSSGKLGTTTSSRRYKREIRDMGERTERLLELRPVTFRDDRPGAEGGPLEYGLVAEEVAEVFPDLVVLDEEGRPDAVRYHLLSSMLLNELEKEHARVEEQARQLVEMRRELAEIRHLIAGRDPAGGAATAEAAAP